MSTAAAAPSPTMGAVVEGLLPPIGQKLALNLFYSLGFMRVSGQIEGARAVDRDGTGKIHRHGDARAADTIASFLTWFDHGGDAEASAASLDRVRRLHEGYARRYAMSPETYVHTIAFFTVQFAIVLELVGASGFTPAERATQTEHWRTIGRHLGVERLPETWDGMAAAVDDYESDPRRFGPTPEGHRCAEALVAQFAGVLPRGLRWSARPILLSLTEDHVLAALGQHRPNAPTVGLVRTAVRATFAVNRRRSIRR